MTFPLTKHSMMEYRARMLLRSRRLGLLIGIMLSLYGSMYGQSVAADTLPDQVPSDQQFRRGADRSFSREKIAAYLEDSDFDYPERDKPVVSLWARFWRWVLSLFPEISIGVGWGPMLRIALYVLCGIVIIYAVLRLLGLDTSQILGRSAAGQVQYAGEIEDIHSINFEQEIKQAAGRRAYRQAIRWCYLWALKKLSDQQRIDWHPGKTNHDYLAELEDRNLRQRLSYLVYLYEYTWYGDFPADEALYRDARQRVERLNEPQPA